MVKIKKILEDFGDYDYVVGLDEVGRGAGAGPVVTAAVIMPKGFKSELIRDSKQLTEKQMKFAELLVYNEGRITGTEAARQAGYEPDRARTTAAELRNANKYPLVAKYIGELREEVQKKYEVTFENHITELARLRDESKNKGAWSAAINAEVARGKAAGLYVDQKIIKYGTLDSLTPQELELISYVTGGTKMDDIGLDDLGFDL
jgi:hypothetical protein